MNYVLRLASCILRWGFIFSALLLAACSLADDITPPPGIELTQTAAAPAPVIPTTRPDPAAGAEIFAQHCIKCHGPTGKGDGELAAQLTGRPPDFTDPATLRNRAPHEIFTAVTQGRLEKTMPPFGNALTAEQRWDVVAHLYTLAEPPAETTEALFAAQCAECHVSRSASDLSALPFFATHTEQDIFDAITSGLADGSHTFAALSEAERWALAQLVQALAYAPSAIAQPGPTPTPGVAHSVTEGMGVSGTVTNGTADAVVPDDVPVEVFVFDSASLVGTYTATTRNGQYAVTGLATQPEHALAASIEYLGVTYVSRIVRVAEGQTHFDLPIEIFETTTDPAGLRIARWHVILAAPEAGAGAGAETVQVAELLIFSNTSDRVLVASGAGAPTLDIPLPEGARNLQFEQNSNLYQATATGFGYTGALLPGAETLQMIFAFDMPLAGQISFVQPIRYPVDGVNVLAPQTGLRVTARNLTGPQTADVQGTPYLAYNGANLSANDSLTLTLAPSGSTAQIFDNATARVWGGLALITVSVATIWLSWRELSKRQRRRTVVHIDPAQRRATLIDALARLDDDFANGQLAEPDYQRRRAKLKAEALALTQQPDN